MKKKNKNKVDLKKLIKKVIPDCKIIYKEFKNRGWEEYHIGEALDFLIEVEKDIKLFNKGE